MKKRIATLLIGMAVLMSATMSGLAADQGTVKAVQEKLNEAGYDCGTPDGIAGSKTIEAVRSYQQEHQLEASGEIDTDLLIEMGLAEAEQTSVQNDMLEETVETSEEFAVDSADPSPEGVSLAAAGAIENLAIEGSVLYNANGIAVTAEVAEDGMTIEYHVQNDCENSALVYPSNLAVNDVTIEADPYGASNKLVNMMSSLSFASSREDFELYAGSFYVEPGETVSFTRDISTYVFSDLFGITQIGKLEASVGIVAIGKTFAFDGTDSLEYEDILVQDDGSLTSVELADASYDGTHPELEGTVLYEDESVRILDLGCEIKYDDQAEVHLVMENRSDMLLDLDDVYDSPALLNGEESTFTYCRLTALPHTLAYGFLDLGLDGQVLESVDSAFCSLELMDKEAYETIAQFDYQYGSDEDATALKEKSETLQSEKDAQREAEWNAEAEQKRADAMERLDWSIEEQVIFEGDGFTITATGAGQEDSWYGGYSTRIYVTVKNDTDKDAHIGLATLDGAVIGEDTYFYVNGFQLEGSAYIDVAAGAAVDEALSFDSGLLEAAGIGNVGEIELQFSIYDENFEPLAEMKPSVIRTSEYDQMDTELDEEMKLVWSEEGFELYAKYVEATEESSAYVLCAVRNNSDKAAGLHFNHLMVNGIEYEDEYFGNYYDFGYELPGRTYLERAGISSDFLEKNGITAIESLSVSFDVGSDQRGNLTPILEAGSVNIPLS